MADPWAAMSPDTRQAMIKVFRVLAKVKSVAEHDSKMDDLAEVMGQNGTRFKKEFREGVRTIMRQHQLSEETACGIAGSYFYGRMIAFPVDGDTQHG